MNIKDAVEKDFDCFDLEEVNICFSEIDPSEISSDVVTKKVQDGWKVVATGEEVDLDKLNEMEEITEWSYPYRLKRDREYDPREISKIKVKGWEKFSEETLRNFSKFKSFFRHGTKVAPETIEKVVRTKKMKKKYLTKIVPREVTYSGVVFK